MHHHVGSSRAFSTAVHREGSLRGFAVTPNREQEIAVLRSVVYASLFEYPLTLEQLQQALIGVGADKHSLAAWWRESELLQSTIECRDGLFFPAGRSDLIATRSRREGVS